MSDQRWSNNVPRSSEKTGCAKMGLMSRAMWHVNRSPFRYAVKSGMSALHLGEKRERRQQAERLGVTTAGKAKGEDLNQDGYRLVTRLMEPVIQQQFCEAGLG